MTLETRMLWLGGVGLAGLLLYLLSPVLTPFIAAALLAYVGDPLADRLQAMRMPRPMAVLSVFVLTFLVLAGLVLLLVPLVRSQASALLDVLPRYIELLENRVWPHIAQYVQPEGDDTKLGLTALLEQFGSTAGTIGGGILASLSRSGSALLTMVVNLALIPILTFYLLRDWDTIIARIGALIPSANRPAVLDLAKQTDNTLAAFLRGQLMVMIGLAVMYTVGLSLIGLQFALAIGVVAGLVSFVPYLGLIFGIGLAGLTAINAPDGGPLLLLLVIAVFTAAQFIEGSVLTPKLVGDQIGLHPVLVIFAVMAFGQLFGFFGILLALPAAAVIAVFVRYAYDNYLREHPEAAEFIEAHDGVADGAPQADTDHSGDDSASDTSADASASQKTPPDAPE
ncbi:MAG: AI-2E family transporter [Pseudomonadota bacterium]